MAETKPTRCAEAPALLKSRSFATGVPSFLVAFTQQVRARAPPRPSRARRELCFRRARASESSRDVSRPRATVTAGARHRSGVLAKHRKRDALTRRIRPSLPSIDRTKPYTMPKKRRANGRNKPAGARGHVSALPSSPARETARAPWKPVVRALGDSARRTRRRSRPGDPGRRLDLAQPIARCLADISPARATEDDTARRASTPASASSARLLDR